ncbi:SDR family NAD(P)-dependent oxidoreductase [Aliivibrio fischeri]|uniref:SDR family oxidoreductase n=1 Tax=Aliivibrio fischeri TaxID=668 RepID=A0A844P0U2_ALIFS|nr:SDR family oxidoreductase [Aliivibrio fischeri]MUK49018.1 SDR family oxidoreductase [Aliivibrio fischeri]
MSDNSKLFVITGASSGIGLSICVKLLQQGHRVLGVSRSEKPEIVELKSNFPNTFIFCEKDLSVDIDSFPKWLFSLSKLHGKFSGLVHAAGMIEIVPIRFNNYQKMSELFNLNLFSGLSLAKAYSDKRICVGSSSSIVFISSVAAHIGSPGLVNYSASKSALIGAAKSLAKELAPQRIRVNTLSPGLIKTNLTEDKCGSAFFDKLEPFYPLGLGQPEYVADATAFLLSDEARWITGIDLVVDGGITLGINE